MSTTLIPPAVTSRYTPEDLLTMPDGDRYELVNGQLVEREMSGLSSLVGSETNRLLGNVARPAQLGWVLQSDASYQCFPHEPGRVRRPDGSFIRRGRISLDQLERGHIRIAPDLAIEVTSPNELADEIDEKVEDYLRAGVHLVWVISPATRTVRIHRPDGSDTRLHEVDELTGEDVLPGFSCRVGELFPAPAELERAE